MLTSRQLEFRWADRQFNVSHHVAGRIAGGVSRNLIVRGVAGRVTEAQIRDHLDHIHNLVVIDVYFQNNDAHVSTNSIHNALFARTCMMSRTIYKGTRIDWAPDECATPLPQLDMRVRPPITRTAPMPLPVMNTYALLDTSSEIDSDTQTESCVHSGIPLEHKGWADTAVA